jgi:hypothetical protein
VRGGSGARVGRQAPLYALTSQRAPARLSRLARLAHPAQPRTRARAHPHRWLAYSGKRLSTLTNDKTLRMVTPATGLQLLLFASDLRVTLGAEAAGDGDQQAVELAHALGRVENPRANVLGGFAQFAWAPGWRVGRRAPASGSSTALRRHACGAATNKCLRHRACSRHQCSGTQPAPC